jgi:hypothetical protein
MINCVEIETRIQDQPCHCVPCFTGFVVKRDCTDKAQCQVQKIELSRTESIQETPGGGSL